MRTRWTCKVVDVKAGFLEVKAATVQETLNPLGLQGRALVTAQQIATCVRLYLNKEI